MEEVAGDDRVGDLLARVRRLAFLDTASPRGPIDGTAVLSAPSSDKTAGDCSGQDDRATKQNHNQNPSKQRHEHLLVVGSTSTGR
jgi:hypothetical protein